MPRPKRAPPPPPVPEPDLLEGAVPDALIDQVYDELRLLQRDATVELAVRMGQLVVQRFYKGNLELYRSHGPKEASLRKLAARFEDDPSGLSAAGIYRAVAVYELDTRLGVSGQKHLTVTHIRALLGLPESDQKKLLVQTEEKGWNSTELEKRAAAVRKKVGDGRGRPPLPAFVKTANLLEKVAADADAFGDLEDLQTMEESRVQGVYDGIVKVRKRLAELEETLAARLMSRVS